MKVFITGTGNISPQKTWEAGNFLNEIIRYHGNRLTCVEPDYEKFIDPRLLRRMSRIIRMSWIAAKLCLSDSGIEVPDAIITGTGMGCLDDTERFLLSIYENDERFLSPTPFIQSTHNAIGSHIALMLQCTNYNMTFTQRGIAFENALSDAISLLDCHNYKHILTGGFDEMTDNQIELYSRLQYYKTGITDNLELLDQRNSGTIAGEGNAYFMLSSEKSDHCYASIVDIDTFNYPKDNEFILQRIKLFLEKNSYATSGIDLYLVGLNGDIILDTVYYESIHRLFNDTPVGYFKHLCGEYHTASAFALWLASHMLKVQQIPEVIQVNRKTIKSIKNILIYNHYQNTNHSLILLTSC